MGLPSLAVYVNTTLFVKNEVWITQILAIERLVGNGTIYREHDKTVWNTPEVLQTCIVQEFSYC